MITHLQHLTPRLAAAAKACFGHTEGSAGAHGVLVAALALQLHAAPPALHVRTLNPYVASALDGWRSLHSQPSVPRAAMALPSAPHCLAGTSSFGMSGVNAHALVAVPTQPPECGHPDLSWQRQRHWAWPARHPLLHAALWDGTETTAR